MPAPKKSVTAGCRSFKTQWTQCKLQSCSRNARDGHDHVLVVIKICLLSRDKDEDEGVPCESEFEKKVWDAKVRGLKGKILAGTDLGSDFWKFYRNCVRFCDLTMTFFQRSEQPASSKWLQSLLAPHRVLHYYFSEPAGCRHSAGLHRAWLYHQVPLDGANISGISQFPCRSFCFLSSSLFSLHPHRTTSAEG